MMPTFISANNEYSCGLACIESILADQGIQKTQEAMIRDYVNAFPIWTEKPGLTSPEACIKIFHMAGLQCRKSFPETAEELIGQFREPDTIGAMLFTSKFYDNVKTRKSISNIRHILRLTKAVKEGIEVMNPSGETLSAAFQTYTWDELIKFEGVVMLLVS